MALFYQPYIKEILNLKKTYRLAINGAISASPLIFWIILVYSKPYGTYVLPGKNNWTERQMS